MAVPIYISPNGLGIPVVISTNGYGLPVVIVSGELPDPVAPQVTSPATIAGSTDPDGVLTLTPGAASGNPAPTRTIAWLFNSTVLSGETGLTLDKDGRVGDFQGRVTWTNSEDSAVSLTNTITTEEVTQPTLTATLSPNPPVEGEVFGVTFSAVPDSYAILQDGMAIPGALTGTDWASASPIGLGAVTIDAEKDGYTAYSVTVEVEPAEDISGDPQMEIVSQPDSTFTASNISETETFDIEVAEPAVHVGTYTIDPTDVKNLPPFWVVDVAAPATIDASAAIHAVGGYWIADAAGGAVTAAVEWRDELGDVIAGLTSLMMSGEQTLEYEDRALTVAQIATNNFGSRETTAVIEVGAYAVQADTFTTDGPTGIGAYVGESGMAWVDGGSGGRATVDGGHLRASVSSAYYVATRADVLPDDQFIEATMVVGSSPSDNGVGLIVRGDAAGRNGFIARHNGSHWYVGSIASGSISSLPIVAGAYAPGQHLDLRFEISGTTLSLFVDGVLTVTGTHTGPASGYPGILTRGSAAAGNAHELTQFNAGGL